MRKRKKMIVLILLIIAAVVFFVDRKFFMPARAMDAEIWISYGNYQPHLPNLLYPEFGVLKGNKFICESGKIIIIRHVYFGILVLKDPVTGKKEIYIRKGGHRR